MSPDQRAVDRGPIAWPERCELPAGWTWGAHVTGSVWWALHEAGGCALVEQRPDLDAGVLDECAEELLEMAEVTS